MACLLYGLDHACIAQHGRICLKYQGSDIHQCLGSCPGPSRRPLPFCQHGTTTVLTGGCLADSLTGSLAHPVTDWDWATRYRDDNIKYKTNTTTYNTALPTGVGCGSVASSLRFNSQLNLFFFNSDI